jgi:hypothetical protein
VNADDLKRFVSYFWNEENSEVVEKDEAMRCLRAFLQVSDLRPVVKQARVSFCFGAQDQLDNEATDMKKVSPRWPQRLHTPSRSLQAKVQDSEATLLFVLSPRVCVLIFTPG